MEEACWKYVYFYRFNFKTEITMLYIFGMVTLVTSSFELDLTCSGLFLFYIKAGYFWNFHRWWELGQESDVGTGAIFMYNDHVHYYIIREQKKH